MNVCKRISVFAILTVFLLLQVGPATAGDTRPGKFVTIEGQEISFFRIDGRDTIKGWLNGTAIDIPIDTVSQIVFFDTPNINYSIFGNDISAGEMEVTRKSDGKSFFLQDAFLPSDCDCTYITYTYRNPFTDETNQGNTALDGLRKLIFFEDSNK
ncbi:hypothetical protein DESUT3_07970 [Desulfuromonas versatilis]|uniref:DUF4369 domain-containing protein n=1 Tax=Desulfuromonas versatilis TaxID=2802975 RepID=A0ABM8HTD2_9BACT|nr:hypothetical protein [Desulfuromonas versatilis]BCR03728.1 hypothetical protein DESUT3_07970 [Desulfuromonas versatilis]